jgi:hypothetical protein
MGEADVAFGPSRLCRCSGCTGGLRAGLPPSALLAARDRTPRGHPQVRPRGPSPSPDDPAVSRVAGAGLQVTLTPDPAAREREALRKATFIVATNALDPEQLCDQDLIAAYKAQSAVERGFAFLQDPLFLASSVFVKQPHRIMALAFIMVVCLLVYRLAEVRVRARLAATHETVPDQLRRPTARPTMRWLFQCFEGIDLHHMTLPEGPRTTQVLRLNAVHRLVLRLLGPAYVDRYLLSAESAK